MADSPQTPRSTLRGLSRLSIDAVREMTHLIEAMHHTILRVPGIVGKAPHGPTPGIAGLVYRSIRGVNSLVGDTLDVLLERLEPLLGEARSGPAGEAGLAALNGVLGDYLVATRNPLAIPMSFRSAGRTLPLQQAALQAGIERHTGRLLVLVHGLCMNDLQWTPSVAGQQREADQKSVPSADLAALLAREAGYTPVYLHYNSGRHISSNGREFSAQLEQLLAQWPVPVESLTLIGHSMGGLVCRSACHYAAIDKHQWPRHLRALVFLGTPHHGAPLERGGNWVDRALGISPYTQPFSRLGKMRSAGITDLRFGYLVDEDWEGRDRFERSREPGLSSPLPAGVPCFAIAATTGKLIGDLSDRLLGDGLVPVSSALGMHADAKLALPIPPERQWVACGLDHWDLLTHPSVHDQIRRWLAPLSP
jgi:pimeloyl-ACP methyl ester carboxylesterase